MTLLLNQIASHSKLLIRCSNYYLKLPQMKFQKRKAKGIGMSPQPGADVFIGYMGLKPHMPLP